MLFQKLNNPHRLFTKLNNGNKLFNKVNTAQSMHNISSQHNGPKKEEYRNDLEMYKSRPHER
jgi:hypothetical protein